MAARICALSWISATPVTASGLAAEWRDLHDRCAAAVTAAAPLDTTGLRPLAPATLTEPVATNLSTPTRDRRLPRRALIDADDGRPFVGTNATDPGNLGTPPRGPLDPDPPRAVAITRFDRAPARIGRAAPAEWGAPGGRLRLRVIEYPARPGTRAICEVTTRPGIRVAVSDAAPIRTAFDALPAPATPNPRGCPVVTGYKHHPATGILRTSVSEGAGDPTCGGASLIGDRR